MDAFLCVYRRQLLKTLWQIEKCPILKECLQFYFIILKLSLFEILLRFLSICFQNRLHRLCDVVVKRSPLVREVVGSIPGQVLPNTLKVVTMSAVLGSQGYGVSITTEWLMSG